MNQQDIQALFITLQLACITTGILLLIATPLAWWLARTHKWYKTCIEALVALPLVLPPTVLGFYLLLALGPRGPIGGIVQAFGGASLAFSFIGLVIGSVVYSLPFAVQPLHTAFVVVNKNQLETASTLGASPIDCFCTIVLPVAKAGFITATVLSFAHTLGEFGVVLMIGGNIPGSTQVVSVVIYDYVESLQYQRAHRLSLLLLFLSFCLLLVVYTFNRRFSLMRL